MGGDKTVMKLSYEDWVAIKDRTEKELEPLAGTGKEPSAKFSKYAFSWDYHYAYPPGSVRLHFNWKSGDVSGWRTNHWSEGIFAPQEIAMDDKYLSKVFDIRRL